MYNKEAEPRIETVSCPESDCEELRALIAFNLPHETEKGFGKKTVLITGAAGLIGSILTEALGGDYNLVLLDKKPSTSKDAWVQADIAQHPELEELFGEEFIDAVIHLAGVLSKEGTWGNVLRNNIIGTRNIFEAARRHKVERVIYTSSNRVVAGWEDDPSFQQPITEEVPPNPLNLYGVSKLACEGLARVYWRDYALPIICLRLGSVREHDDPCFEGPDSRLMKTWLSHRDLVQLVKLCLKKRNPTFAIYNVFSANTGCPYSVAKASDELGYQPKDNAANFRS